MLQYSFSCLVVVFGFFSAVKYVASEDDSTTTTEVPLDTEVSEIIQDRFRRPHPDICLPDAYCAFQAYKANGRITGAFTYCSRCPDGFDCTLVQNNKEKLYLRYKCLATLVGSSTEDTTEGVSETEQGDRAWPKVLDLTGNIFFKRKGRQEDSFTDNYDQKLSFVTKREGSLDFHEDVVATTDEDPLDDEVSEIIQDRFSCPHPDICLPNAYCAFRAYKANGTITGAFTYCSRCPDGFDCTLVQNNKEKLYLRYKCLPAVVGSSTEDTTEGVSETVQAGMSWPKVLDLTGDLFVKRKGRQDRFTDNHEQSSISERTGPLDIHEL